MEKYYDIRIPDTGHQFEILTQIVFSVLYKRPFELYGRNGQDQSGIDLFSKDFEICVQCKNYQGYDAAKRLHDGMEHDILVAYKKFGKSIKKYILATTVMRDNRIQDYIDILAQEYKSDIIVFFWEDFQVALKQHPEIIVKYNQATELPDLFDICQKTTPFTSENRCLFHAEKLLQDELPKCILNHFSIKPDSTHPLGRRVPSIRPFFTGRLKEQQAIHQQLLDNRVAFLYGPRGIGKSALAAEYAANVNIFSSKIWLTYDHSLKHTIESIVLSDVASEERGLSPFEKNFRWLQSLSNDVLIVLDNFDVLEENEPLFYNFINCGFTLLVTSHVHHESCCEIPIYEMQIDELRELFCHYYTKNELSNPQINDLIYAAHSHTMVVELMAKLMQNSPVSYDTLVSELRKSIAELALPVNVVLSKDGSTKNAIIRKHLEVLFDLSSLQDGELQTLIFMAYMPLDGVSETLFTKWADDVYGNSVTQLHRLGWIERHPENNIIKTHPIIREITHTRHKIYQNEIQRFVNKSVQHCKTEQSKNENLGISIASAIGYRLSDFNSILWITTQFENASNLQNLGRKASALTLMENILDQAQQIEIPNYLHTFLLYRIGCLKLDMAEFDEALAIFENALSVDAGEHIYEVAYCSLLTNCLLECSLAFAMKSKNTISQRFLVFAEKLLHVLPDIEEKKLQSRFYYKQGEILRLQGKYQMSIEAFENAIAIRNELFGKDSLEVGLCYAQIGLVYRKLAADDMAAKNLYTAYCIFDQILPETHPNIVSVQLSLGIVLENLTGQNLEVVQLLDYLSGLKTFEEVAKILPVLRERVSALMTRNHSQDTITRPMTPFSNIITSVASAFGTLLSKFTKAKAHVMRDESGWRTYGFGRNYDLEFIHTSNAGPVLDDEAIVVNPHQLSMSNSGDWHTKQAYFTLYHGVVPNRPIGTSDIMTQVLGLIDELPSDFLKSNTEWFEMLTKEN